MLGLREGGEITGPLTANLAAKRAISPSKAEIQRSFHGNFARKLWRGWGKTSQIKAQLIFSRNFNKLVVWKWPQLVGKFIIH